MDTCPLPPFNHLPPKKLPDFSSDYRSRGLPSPSAVEHLNEKREYLPPLNSILHSTLPELQNTSILIPRPQHTPTNHVSTAPSQQHHEQQMQAPNGLRVNSSYPPILHEPGDGQGANNDNIKHRPLPTQPNPHSLPPPSQPHNNAHPPIWSRAGSPHSPVEQIQLYQQSLPHHPYENTGSMRHINAISGYPYRSTGDVRSPQVQTTEQSLAKMSKVIDYCNRISQHISQCRDARPWPAAPQVNEAQLTDMISLTHDVLDILNGLKGELTSKAATESILNNDDFELVRKTRTQRMKYRKRSKRAAPPGRCHSCNISETPEWRRGPDGARTLCNACGLHFAKITRKRALMLMQQQYQHSTTELSSTTRPNMSHNTPIYRNTGVHGLPLTSMPTPGTSDAEREGPPNKRTRVDVKEELNGN